MFKFSCVRSLCTPLSRPAHDVVQPGTAILVLLTALVLPGSGHAQAPLGLADAQRIAVERSRLLAAQDASIVASREMAAAAGQLPDPVLKLGIDNLPVDGADRFSLNRDFMTMRRIGVMQEFSKGTLRPGDEMRGCLLERPGRDPVKVDLIVRFDVTMKGEGGKAALKIGCQLLNPSREALGLIAEFTP